MILSSYDKKEIFVHEWTDVIEPCGVVQIAHGMGEHAGRYERFARRLNSLGYVVVADDHRGHGNTDAKTLGYAAGDMFADTVKDMAGLAKHFRERYPDLKYVLFGFSYGSFLTQAFIEKYARFLDGAIIAGSSRQPSLAVLTGAAVARTGALCKGEAAPAEFVNRVVFGGYNKKFEDGEFLSTDAENNEAYRNDSYCNFVCSNNFYRSFFKGMRGLYKKAGAAGLDPDLPLLLISGAEDAVGGERGVGRLYDFYKKSGVKDVSKYLIEGSRHEFLNEKDHFEEGFAQISAFLKRVSVRKK